MKLKEKLNYYLGNGLIIVGSILGAILVSILIFALFPMQTYDLSDPAQVAEFLKIGTPPSG